MQNVNESYEEKSEAQRQKKRLKRKVHKKAKNIVPKEERGRRKSKCKNVKDEVE